MLLSHSLPLLNNLKGLFPMGCTLAGHCCQSVHGVMWNPVIWTVSGPLFTNRYHLLYDSCMGKERPVPAMGMFGRIALHTIIQTPIILSHFEQCLLQHRDFIVLWISLLPTLDKLSSKFPWMLYHTIPLLTKTESSELRVKHWFNWSLHSW